jgi:hypothetical protein
MKNIILIILGILIGSGIMICVQYMNASSKVTVVNEFKDARGEDMKLTDMSTDRLVIQNLEDIILSISSKEMPCMSLEIKAQSGFNDPNKSYMMNEIIVHDKNGIHTVFSDQNSDGIWDEKTK